jgi:putative membrane protein
LAGAFSGGGRQMSEDHESQQIALMKRLVEMSGERSQMSQERTYMNAERTLAVWVRTALSLMIFGIAIDRYGLLLRQMPVSQIQDRVITNDLSHWGGGALVALGILMVLSSGGRFIAYSIAYQRVHQLPLRHGPQLGAVFAALVAIFGIALLIILIEYTQ